MMERLVNVTVVSAPPVTAAVTTPTDRLGLLQASTGLQRIDDTAVPAGADSATM